MKAVTWFVEILFITNVLHGFAEYESNVRGPSFLLEPPSKLDFSNSSGAWLDCSASGNPSPTIDWLSVDGSPIGEVHGVRRVLRNGTLVLQPFPPAGYRQDIHNTVYRCIISNTVGKVVSRDVQVRAVVTQAYKVTAEVLSALRGCTAVLRCSVPSFVRDMVRVVSWVQEPSFYIYPSLQGDGKYHLLPTGDLLIHNVEFSDQYPAYRCRTMHRLSRHVELSSPANIQLSEPRGVVPPGIMEHTGSVHVAQDEGAVLLCIAQGCPTPDYRWYDMQSSTAEPMTMVPGPRTRILGPLLVIEAVTAEDSGTYRCTASNAGGEASAELRLFVATTLQVEVTPAKLSVHVGGGAEFRCSETSASHYSSPPLMITWYKDGRVLPGVGRLAGDRLVLTNVGREDRGMYQCLVRRSEGDTAQAAAELQLGDSPPLLLYSFIEQTLQPGPAVSLKCSAAGNPTPQIKWTLDGFVLPTNGRFVIGQYVTVHGDVISHVNITRVAVEDGGEYACVAQNRAGSSTHAARLNVYGSPYIRLIPKVTAVAGEEMVLKCPVAGFPIEEIHWERSGRVLPDDLRQKVTSDGTLTIKSVQKATDAGVYSCSARNKQGHSTRRNAEVSVIVPPVIETFSFQEELSEGMRTRTMCGVSRGDPPITITWLKDGNSLAHVVGANVSAIDLYSSLLSISSLASFHTGEYTCVASNAAAETRFSAKLQVKVPPTWLVEPRNVSVERNRQVMLHCQAQGVPQPTVTWRKAIGSKTGDYEELRDRIYTKVFGNGTLLLQNVKEDREGYYMCQANNGIGTGIGKQVQVRVNSFPYFTTPSSVVTVKKGETASLRCEVNGDKPISVLWSRGGSGSISNKMELSPTSNYRVAVKQVPTAEGVVAELQLVGAETGDAGTYFCQASNLYGRDQQMVKLMVQGN